MKRIKILAVIAIIALAGCLVFACSSGSDSGGDDAASGSSAVNGFQGGKKGGGGGGSTQRGGNEITDPAKIVDLLGDDVVEVGKKNGQPIFLVKKGFEVPAGKSVGFEYPVTLTGDAVTDGLDVSVSPNNTVTFLYGFTNETGVDLSVDGGGKVIIGGKDAAEDDSTEIGNVTVAGGSTVAIQMNANVGDISFDEDGGQVRFEIAAGSDLEEIEVEAGEITISPEGSLLVGAGVTLSTDEDVTVEGGLALNGTMEVTNITLVKGDSEGPNAACAVTGTGTLDVSGDMTVQISPDQLTDASGGAIDKTTLIGMANGAKAVFNAGSTLKISDDDTLEYYVFSDDPDDDPDYAITDGKVTVTGGAGGKQTFKLEGEATVIGGFITTLGQGGVLGGDPVVVLWGDFVVAPGSKLTVDDDGPTVFIIASGFTLTNDFIMSSNVPTAGTVTTGTAGIIKNEGGTIANKGLIALCDTDVDDSVSLVNNGTITNAGTGVITVGNKALLLNAAAQAASGGYPALPVGTITNQANGVIEVDSTDSEGAKFTNNGTITNAGDIKKKTSAGTGGTLDGTGTYSKTGSGTPGSWSWT